jgi:hypothetical protein
MTLTKKIFILLGVTLAVNYAAYAAQPKSIKHVADIVEGEVIYGHYIVTCSNGKEVDVSAWDNKDTWCIGMGLKDDCVDRQIKIAKNACKGA